jgi:hypothetical protein
VGHFQFLLRRRVLLIHRAIPSFQATFSCRRTGEARAAGDSSIADIGGGFDDRRRPGVRQDHPGIL